MNPDGLQGDAVKRLSVGLKLSYGSGQAVDAVLQGGVNVFLLFYLTAVCGMSGAAAGSVLFISLGVDAVLDPLIGQLSDNWRSRLGRRLPFMIAALLPMMAAAVALFSIPRSLSGMTLFAYALGLNVVLRVSISLFVLPHSALTAELTNDYSERSVISGFRAIFLVVGTAACVLPAFQIIFGGPGGLQSRAAYPWLGAWLAVLTLFFGLWCLLGAGRRILALPMPRSTSWSTQTNVLGEIGRLFRNRSFVPLFIVAVLVLVGQGASGALSVHAFRFFWQLAPEQLQLPVLSIPVGMIAGTAIAALLLKRFEKRDVLVSAILVVVVGPTLLPILLQVGVLLPGTALSLSLLIGNGFVFGACSALCVICFNSMIADAVDEHDHLFGVRCEALYASTLMLGSKAATGLGGLFAGLGLQLVGFSAAGPGSKPSPEAIAGLGVLWGPGGAVLMVVALPILRRYKVDRKRHAEVIASLAARRGFDEAAPIAP